MVKEIQKCDSDIDRGGDITTPCSLFHIQTTRLLPFPLLPPAPSLFQMCTQMFKRLFIGKCDATKRKSVRTKFLKTKTLRAVRDAEGIKCSFKKKI